MNESMKKIIFIVNPISGTQGKELVLNLLDEKIDKERYTWDVVYTKRAGHAIEIAAQAAAEKADVVVAIGGDGTINEIGRSLVHTETALGIIPCGSGNGLARHLHIPMEPKKALEIINKYTNPDVREARLKSGLGSASYRAMMNEYYPRLRRLSIAIDYEIREVRNSEAATLIYTNPKMLNLQEMHGVAKNFRPGTKEYREVYEIAATNYPTDIVANINAASANIVYGDFDRAQQYIERVKDDPRAWNNLGVLAWLSGDSEIAKEWFTKALTIEPEKAQENLNKIKQHTHLCVKDKRVAITGQFPILQLFF